MRPLIAAGFTADELRAVAREAMFSAQVAEDFGESIPPALEDAVAWTPEKRAAWREVMRRTQGPDTEP